MTNLKKLLLVCSMFAVVAGCSSKGSGLTLKQTGRWVPYYQTDETMVWEVANHNSKNVRGGSFCMYFYDNTGAQQKRVCQENMGFSPTLTAGQTRDWNWVNKKTIPPGNSSVEIVFTKVEFEDKSTWEDSSIAPEQRKKGGS